MTTTLITGGNNGLGFETAGRLAAAGHHVVIGSRDAERGRTAAEALGVDCVVLDAARTQGAARAAEGVDLEVALERPGAGGPDLPTVAAAVQAAHDAGLQVIAPPAPSVRSSWGCRPGSTCSPTCPWTASWRSSSGPG